MQSECEESIQVLLVAPQMTRWGLQQLVQSSSGHFQLAGACDGLAQAREALARSPADVVVVDCDEPGEQALLRAFVNDVTARVVVLTGLHELQVLDGALLDGLKGIVRKSEPPGVLLKAMEKVHQGELWIDRSATSRIFMEMAREKAREKNDPERTKIATLTVRERQAIMALAADTGSPGKVIASRLCISEHTLRNHLSSIYSKLDLSNRLDLYAYATRHQLDRPA